MKELKFFYDSLYNEGIIYIIDHEDDILPEIIHRAVNRKKPFSENKNELKDALTWLSYAKFVEDYELINCILITDNVRNFCDLEKLKKDELVIHNDLLNDTKRFRIYRSIKDFLQSEDKILSFSSVRFLQWVNHQDFNDAFVINILRNDLSDDVKRSIKDKFAYYNLSYIFGTDYSVEGFIAFDDQFFLHRVENIEVDTFDEECILSGDVFISCSAQAYEYSDGINDSDDDSYRYFINNMSSGNEYRLFGEKELNIKVTFSFYYNRNERPFNLSIDSIELT
ncbi:PIN domain-containing protein [Hymenobacter nivis]|uniref:PIN domain-containing protein n=1 Tax=Hymenobacter nivis TaxID=1850093 RepID=UPI0013A58948|nr:PIN domain-containing protein [Hymenobacter nivis]